MPHPFSQPSASFTPLAPSTYALEIAVVVGEGHLSRLLTLVERRGFPIAALVVVPHIVGDELPCWQVRLEVHSRGGDIEVLLAQVARLLVVIEAHRCDQAG